MIRNIASPQLNFETLASSSDGERFRLCADIKQHFRDIVTELGHATAVV
jgi:hypothetical protein